MTVTGPADTVTVAGPVVRGLLQFHSHTGSPTAPPFPPGSGTLPISAPRSASLRTASRASAWTSIPPPTRPVTENAAAWCARVKRSPLFWRLATWNLFKSTRRALWFR
jgi:hypothetical protein